MQERATHAEEVTVREQEPRAEPAPVATRTVPPAEVLHAVAITLAHELEVAPGDRAIVEPHRAGREPSELHRWACQREHGGGVHACHADERRGRRARPGVPVLEQRSYQRHRGRSIRGRLDPEMGFAGQPHPLSREEPAAKASLQHRSPYRAGLGAPHPDAVVGEVQLQESSRQSGEADAVVIAPADRPGPRLQRELRADPACLELQIHGRPRSQWTCQREPSSE